MKVITTKYHGPASVRGARYSANDGGDNRIMVGADDTLNSEQNHDRTAITLCLKMGWTRHKLVRGNARTGNVYVFLDADQVLDLNAPDKAIDNNGFTTLSDVPHHQAFYRTDGESIMITSSNWEDGFGWRNGSVLLTKDDVAKIAP